MQPLIKILKNTIWNAFKTQILRQTDSKTAKTMCDNSIIVWEYFHDCVTVSDSDVQALFTLWQSFTIIALMIVKCHNVNVTITYNRTIMKVLSHCHKNVIVIELSHIVLAVFESVCLRIVWKKVSFAESNLSCNSEETVLKLLQLGPFLSLLILTYSIYLRTWSIILRARSATLKFLTHRTAQNFNGNNSE